MVLEHPVMDITMLPIITDDELNDETPLHNRTMASTLAAATKDKVDEKKKATVSLEILIKNVFSRQSQQLATKPSFALTIIPRQR
jgi:hypothetical protein